MGKDTTVVGVRTPGVSTVVRQRHKLAAPDWLALCVAEKDGKVMHVLKAQGIAGTRLSSFGAGHHHITCFVVVRLTLAPAARC